MRSVATNEKRGAIETTFVQKRQKLLIAVSVRATVILSLTSTAYAESPQYGHLLA
jgi:hypothetical protein